MEFLNIKKPVTSGQRHKVQFKNFLVRRRHNIKYLTEKLRKHSGRNHSGQLSLFTKGGGHKRKYRQILF